MTLFRRFDDETASLSHRDGGLDTSTYFFFFKFDPLHQGSHANYQCPQAVLVYQHPCQWQTKAAGLT